ncbi:MAG: GlsB/YeaQ/YmgE family stress response membrane protein [Deltaproteobacteria bacterium]|nr:GlsB/YeaQ/YmgE family stress response membrane protein [Deltaproteobacteria bacterium]
MDIVTWIVVGLVAGVLASYLIGGIGYGLPGDILIGIAGSFVGSFLFRQFGWHSPFKGLGGVIFIAFVGAAVVLVLARLLAGRRPVAR